MVKQRKRGKRNRRRPKEQPATSTPLVRYRTALLVVGLLAVHYVLALTSVRNKSNTYDELAHLTRGYSYRMTGDFRLGPPHPPLAHYWATMTADLSRVRPPIQDHRYWYRSDMWNVGRVFFFYQTRGNAAIIDSLLFRGRAMIALLSVACGVLVFFWSRWLFDSRAALISVALFAFSPTMLAHARLVTTDCAVTLFFIAALGAIAWVLRKVSPVSVIVGSLAMAGLFLSKMSAVLIIPVGLAAMILRLIDARPLNIRAGSFHREIQSRIARLGVWLGVMTIWVLITWAGLWAAYGFRYEAMKYTEPGRDQFYSNSPVPEGKTVWQHVLRGLDHLEPTVTWLREHRVFPQAYIYCAAYGAQTARGRNAFLNGEINILGFTEYFPYTFLVKTPLPLMALLVLAIGALFLRRPVAARAGPRETLPEDDRLASAKVRAWRWFVDASPLLVFFVVYWIASLRSNLNIGHRHIMPTYPVIFILCGATAVYSYRRMAAVRWVVVGLLCLFALASLASFPNYLAYFNRTIGDPDRAYHHLVDSSLDWGQDLPGLRNYLDRRRSKGYEGNVYVAYFGSGHTLAVDHYGIDAIDLPMRVDPDQPGDYRYRPGLYAISATILQSLYYSPSRSCRWTEAEEKRYQQQRQRFEPLIDSPDSAEAAQRMRRNKFYQRFEKLRLGRLCAYLRKHEPDHVVNRTILIFNLDQKKIDDALNGPAPFDNTPASS